MKILLLGKKGQVGWELQRALAPLGDVIALGRDSVSHCADLSNEQGLLKTIREIAPHVLVNAAAYTAVDKAESEPDLAFLVNAKSVDLMAKEMASLDGWLVHYSTDYVFNGSGNTAWRESDSTDPLSIYGKTKLAGEEAIISRKVKHLIFRTSWVYGSHGNNFIKTILKLAQERESLSIVADQIGVPTGAELIADVTAHAIKACLQRTDLSGLYHLAPLGETSWYHFAHYILEEARALGKTFQVSDLTAINSQEYPRPAQRPLNSRLNTQKLCNTFSLEMPEWTMGVKRVLLEILGSNQ